MPAHTPLSAIGRRTRSDGTVITYVDRRVNALVDGLAKFGADLQRVPSYILKMFTSAEAGVEHAVGIIGVTCKAANNLPSTATDAEGTVRKILLRDSIPMSQLDRKAKSAKVRIARALARKAAKAKKARLALEVIARRTARDKAACARKLAADAASREKQKQKSAASLGKPAPKVVWRDPVKVAANNKAQNARRSALKRGRVLATVDSSTASSSTATCAVPASSGPLPETASTALVDVDAERRCLGPEWVWDARRSALPVVTTSAVASSPVSEAGGAVQHFLNRGDLWIITLLINCVTRLTNAL